MDFKIMILIITCTGVKENIKVGKLVARKASWEAVS